MSKLDSHITIDEKAIVRCVDSEHFIRKPFKIDHLNLSIEGPHKVLDGKSITLRNASTLVKDSANTIYECAKRIERLPSWQRLHFLLEESGKGQKDGISAMNEFFGLRKDLRESRQTVLSLVLTKHPLRAQKFSTDEGKKTVSFDPIDKYDYERLLDYIHAASKAVVLAPDLRFGGSGAQNLKEYLEYVDYNMQVLSTHNQKPIFAPIQPEIPGSSVRAILEHYKSKGYPPNMWLNFNGGQWDGTYFAYVRGLLRWIDELYGTKESPGLNHACLYYSHVKKEQNPHIKEDAALSSDILSQFFCSDFIGVNQPRRQGGRNKKEEEERINALIKDGQFKNRQEYRDEYKAHHNRVFDSDSYYYYKISKFPRKLNVDEEFVTTDRINRLFNSDLLRLEIQRTKTSLDETRRIKPYLKKKRALMDNTFTMDGLFTDVPPDASSLTAKLGGI